jgi:hypothetical protein
MGERTYLVALGDCRFSGGNSPSRSRGSAVAAVQAVQRRPGRAPGLRPGPNTCRPRVPCARSAPADFVLEEDGPAYVGPDTAAQPWRFGPPGNPVIRGMDVLTLRDGKVSAVRGLIAS